jgi:hypothetical protein
MHAVSVENKFLKEQLAIKEEKHSGDLERMNDTLNEGRSDSFAQLQHSHLKVVLLLAEQERLRNLRVAISRWYQINLEAKKQKQLNSIAHSRRKNVVRSKLRSLIHKWSHLVKVKQGRSHRLQCSLRRRRATQLSASMACWKSVIVYQIRLRSALGQIWRKTIWRISSTSFYLWRGRLTASRIDQLQLQLLETRRSGESRQLEVVREQSTHTTALRATSVRLVALRRVLARTECALLRSVTHAYCQRSRHRLLLPCFVAWLRLHAFQRQRCSGAQLLLRIHCESLLRLRLRGWLRWKQAAFETTVEVRNDRLSRSSACLY